MVKIDKWEQYLTLIKNEEIAQLLPETLGFSLQEELWNFVDRYQTVILKPRLGNQGKKIFKITELEKDKFEIHYLNSKKVFIGKDQAYAYVQKNKAPRPYIVQRYIPLANVQGRPIDIRVIVQKQKNSNDWVVTGKVAKLAGKGFFVTNNTISGGSVLPIAEAIKKSNIHILDEDIEKLVSEIERITLLTTNTLETLYQNRSIYGFDIGIDSDGHIWIIEGNLSPSFSHFYKLKDKKMFNTIKKLYRGKISRKFGGKNKKMRRVKIKKKRM